MRSNQENRLKPYFAELEVNIKVGIENFDCSLQLYNFKWGLDFKFHIPGEIEYCWEKARGGESPAKMVNLMICWFLSSKPYLSSKVLGKVVEAAKEEDKKVLLVRQNKAKILKVFIDQHS